MLVIPPELLIKLLHLYEGTPIKEENLTAYQIISLMVFSNPQKVSNPFDQFTSQIAISEIYENYQTNYKKVPGATFTAFIKWLAIKVMSNTPFNWRFINGKWYEFNNLPLEVLVRTQNKRQQGLYFLNDVSYMPWDEFCSKHASIAKGELTDNFEIIIKEIPLFHLATEVVGRHMPKTPQYEKTIKENNSHQPWMVFSSKYKQDGELYLIFHIKFSQATLTPALAEDFFNKFIFFAKKSPKEVFTFCQMLRVKEQQNEVSISNPIVNPSYIPRYHSKNEYADKPVPSIPFASYPLRAKL